MRVIFHLDPIFLRGGGVCTGANNQRKVGYTNAAQGTRVQRGGHERSARDLGGTRKTQTQRGNTNSKREYAHCASHSHLPVSMMLSQKTGLRKGQSLQQNDKKRRNRKHKKTYKEQKA